MKKLYRSTQQRVLGGVCAGFAQYFNLDPILVRILFVLAFFFGASGLLIYIVSWILMPPSSEF